MVPLVSIGLNYMPIQPLHQHCHHGASVRMACIDAAAAEANHDVMCDSIGPHARTVIPYATTNQLVEPTYRTYHMMTRSMPHCQCHSVSMIRTAMKLLVNSRAAPAVCLIL